MARVTIEDCLKRVPNRFALVHMTAQRVRQLRDGAPPLLESKNKEVVQALREIAGGQVFPVSREEAEEGRARAEAEERARLAQASLAATMAQETAVDQADESTTNQEQAADTPDDDQTL